MALLLRGLKNRCQLSRESLLCCSQCCIQSRTFVPPTGREYGLEKKWAYYNQPAIDTYAAKVYTEMKDIKFSIEMYCILLKSNSALEMYSTGLVDSDMTDLSIFS